MINTFFDRLSTIDVLNEILGNYVFVLRWRPFQRHSYHGNGDKTIILGVPLYVTNSCTSDIRQAQCHLQRLGDGPTEHIYLRAPKCHRGLRQFTDISRCRSAWPGHLMLNIWRRRVMFRPWWPKHHPSSSGWLILNGQFINLSRKHCNRGVLLSWPAK